MPTIKQLPTATSVGASDILPVSQGGSTRGLSISNLLSSVQPALTLATGKLLGRISPSAGSPEVVGLGSGLAVSGGNVTATATDHLSLPAADGLKSDDEVLVNSNGSPMRLPASALRGLFSAGSGISIAGDGTITSTGPASAAATASQLGSVKPGTGLSVAPDGTLSVSASFSIATVPSITHQPFGSAPSTLGSLVVQSTDNTAAPATRQFGSTFGMVALTGEPSGDAAGGDRSTMYIGMAAQPGGGGTRALTVSHGLAAGYAGHVAAAVEVDLGSGGPHRGDLADYAGQRLYNADGSLNPVFFGVSIDGASDYRVTGALRLAGQCTKGGGLYNYGISVDQGCVSQVTFGDFCNSDRSIADFGAHRHWADVSRGTYSQAALLLGAGHVIGSLDASGTERRLIVKRSSDGAVLLGDSDAPVVMSVPPTHPTPPISDNSNSSATTAYVSARIAALGTMTGPAGPAGQGFNFRGAWTASTAYAPYDVVTYDGQTYAVTAAFTSGVTFSSANLGLLAASGAVRTVGAGLSAAGVNQTTALALTTDESVVTSVGTGMGVMLRSSSSQRILNRGANPLLVYPPVGGSIEARPVNSPVSVPVGGSALFVSSDNSNFYAA